MSEQAEQVEQATTPTMEEVIAAASKPSKPYAEYKAEAKEARPRGGVQERIDRVVKDRTEITKVAEDAISKVRAEAENAIKAATAPVAAKPAESAPTAAPAKTVEQLQAEAAEIIRRKQGWDGFYNKSQEYAKTHPDLFDSIREAGNRGIALPLDAQESIIALDNGPEVIYWLSRPENELAARRLGGLSGVRAAAEVGRISAQLELKPVPVSKAPAPGTRLSGSMTAANEGITGRTFMDYKREMKQRQRIR